MQGHKDGSEVLTKLIEWCIEEGIGVVTVYAFSTENWKREEQEIDVLMKLVDDYFKDMLEESMKQDIRVRVLSTNPEYVRTLSRINSSIHIII